MGRVFRLRSASESTTRSIRPNRLARAQARVSPSRASLCGVTTEISNSYHGPDTRNSSSRFPSHPPVPALQPERSPAYDSRALLREIPVMPKPVILTVDDELEVLNAI